MTFGKYTEERFNMGMLFYLRRPSKWVYFQTPNTQIRAFFIMEWPPGLAVSLHCSLYKKCVHVNLHRSLYIASK